MNTNNVHWIVKVFALLFVVAVTFAIYTRSPKQATVKIEYIPPASGSVTQAAPSGAAPEAATTTTVEVASSPSLNKTGEARRINFTVRPQLGNGTNR